LGKKIALCGQIKLSLVDKYNRPFWTMKPPFLGKKNAFFRQENRPFWARNRHLMA